MTVKAAVVSWILALTCTAVSLVTAIACAGETPGEGSNAASGEWVPAFVELLAFAAPADDPRPGERPAVRLDPAGRELRLTGGTEGEPSRRVERVITLHEGLPLAMCWGPGAQLAVALHAEDGDTIVLGWTWDGERLVGEERPLFRGPVGIVTGIAAHPRTGALILLDANGGRLLEVLGREVCRVLADTGTIPGLRGRRSLDVTEVADPPGTVVYSVTTIPPDTDSIDDSDGILEIRDEDPTDGRFDGWEVFRP